MPGPPRLPVELLHEVLLNLRNDFSALKECSLTCSTLRFIVQQHLYSELTFGRFPPVPLRDTSSTYRPFEDDGETLCSRLLKPSHSHLLSHVRHLKLQCYPPPGKAVPDPFFKTVLERIPAEKLTRITILRRYRDDPLSDTEAMVRELLHRSTALQEFRLEDRRVPASYLNACSPSLKVLRIHGTEFVEDEIPSHSWSRLDSLFFPLRMLPECLLWMVLGSVGGAGAHLFPSLRHLFVGDEVKDVEIVNQVLDGCATTLHSLAFTAYGYNFSSYPNLCRNQNGNIIEFTIPSSLRLLAINCPIILKPASRSSTNPFGWLSHTFRQLFRQPCSLEIVHIKFLTTRQIENLDAIFPGGFPIDKCFHEFDKLLSNQKHFPFLKKIYLTVGRHYLGLFADPKTLPLLSERGLLKVIYEEVDWSEPSRYWEYQGPQRLMASVEAHPWDGKTCSFLSFA